MLEDVLAGFLDTLTEREFDAPFLAFLRGSAFGDIHFLHGSTEFGKDFIAKTTEDGVDTQWVFQTKAGDIGQSEWRTLRGQLDELVTNSLAHPSFAEQAVRRCVLVTTGRLVGNAKLAAQDYVNYRKDRGEAPLEIWDRETLIERLLLSPEIGLTGCPQGAFLEIMGRAERGAVSDAELEVFSRRWIASPETSQTLWRSTVEAAVLAQRLSRAERLDLACYSALCLIRAGGATFHSIEGKQADAIAASEIARDLFLFYADELRRRVLSETEESNGLLDLREGPSAFVTYPTRCLRTVECLGLLGLLLVETDRAQGLAVARLVLQLMVGQSGSEHPVSDRWAVSLIPPVLLLAVAGKADAVPPILEEVIRWVGDRYEKGLGLASSYSSPEQEVQQLLGAPFEHVPLNHRPESYLATVVLDLATLLELPTVFELAVNDFRAVGALPCVVEADDTLDQYVMNGTSLSFEPNVPFASRLIPTEPTAPHQARGPSRYHLARVGRAWDHLAVSAVLRDRHFYSTCREVIARAEVSGSDNGGCPAGGDDRVRGS